MNMKSSGEDSATTSTSGSYSNATFDSSDVLKRAHPLDREIWRVQKNKQCFKGSYSRGNYGKAKHSSRVSSLFFMNPV